MDEVGAGRFRESADSKECAPQHRVLVNPRPQLQCSNNGDDFLGGLVLNLRREKRGQKRASILFPKLRD